jgi:hypothetical protein
MSNCKLDADASQGFVDWMSDSAKNNVRELYFHPQSQHLLDTGTTFGRGIAKALVNSNLHVFHFPGNEVGSDPKGFFKEMKLHSDLIQLPSLQIDFLGDNLHGSYPAAACADYLSTTTSLRKFTIADISSFIPSKAFMYAIGRNGSLHEISAVDKEKGDFWDAFEKKHVDAFCARNRFLPDLLANARSSLQECLRVGKDATRERSGLALLPWLLKVSRQARRMAPNNILIGLLCSMDNSMEPARGSERVSMHE